MILIPFKAESVRDREMTASKLESARSEFINPLKSRASKKKNEILPFVTTRTDLEGIMLSDIS